MNEAQVRHDLIDPALKAAGWESLPARSATEQQVAQGHVENNGVCAAQKCDLEDDVLVNDKMKNKKECYEGNLSKL